MGEIKHHSDQLAPVSGDRAYLQRVVENALAQTERVCGLVKQLAGPDKAGFPIPVSAEDADVKAARTQQVQRVPSAEAPRPDGPEAPDQA